MKTYPEIGLGIPQFYLPRKGIDLQKWAVIACDQFTSEKEYWDKVTSLVGGSPSTLHLTLPEIYLGSEEEARRLSAIQSAMSRYLQDGTLEAREGLVYIERRVAGKLRRGLLACLDLEAYDYRAGSTSLIRATEGTILDRLPPRIKIREQAQLEFPHILVLIDDPADLVIGTAQSLKAPEKLLYDFELMLGSGHLSGWMIDQGEQHDRIASLIADLGRLPVFREKYQLPDARDVLLYAMGDGNHSLATAKAIWERNREVLGMSHPSRYALVELENIHDPGLEFEPIHRVLFGVKEDLLPAMKSHFGQMQTTPYTNAQELLNDLAGSRADQQRIGWVDQTGLHLIELSHPAQNLPVGNLQGFLDALMKRGGAGSLDYVHGSDSVLRLGSQPGNAGFLLPGMGKSELFKTVILDGALPRKTFSMGEAIEKRFYLEGRRIR